MLILEQLTFWHWWVLGLALLILELFAPAAYFIWFGASAAVIGVLLLLFPFLTWQTQLFIFAVLSVVAVLAGRRLFPARTADEGSTLNRRGEQYVGRQFTLETPIRNGVGRVRVDDSSWRVVGPDREEGETVTVKAVDGASFVVE